MITQLARIAESLCQSAEQLTALAAAAAAVTPISNGSSLLEVARVLARERQMMRLHLPSDLFSDPARDILLDLFIARTTGARISITSACIAAQAPPTTALRYVARLCEEGLLDRVADERDGRRIFVTLSDRGWDAMLAYLEAARCVWSTGSHGVASASG